MGIATYLILLFHVDADPDDKRIALVPLLIEFTLVSNCREKDDYPALNWLYSYARTVSKWTAGTGPLPTLSLALRSFSVLSGFVTTTTRVTRYR